MLEDYRIQYAQYADTHLDKDWRKENKNVLFNKCLEAKSISLILYNAYISALLYRYWNAINIYYRKDKNSASYEDIYGWLLESLLYVLDRHVWTDPDNVLYGDPNGPDKAFNIRLKGSRLSHYERTNTAKRRAAINTLSIDKFIEDGTQGENILPELCYEEGNDTRLLVKSLFNKKDYFSAFLIYSILYECPAEDIPDSRKQSKEKLYNDKLIRSMQHIDDKVCKLFANTYNIDLTQVKTAAETCTSLNRSRIKKAIQFSFCKLRKILAED